MTFPLTAIYFASNPMNNLESIMSPGLDYIGKDLVIKNLQQTHSEWLSLINGLMDMLVILRSTLPIPCQAWHWGMTFRHGTQTQPYFFRTTSDQQRNAFERVNEQANTHRLQGGQTYQEQGPGSHAASQTEASWEWGHPASYSTCLVTEINGPYIPWKDNGSD